MKLLILIDHTNHTVHNSVYLIAQALVQSEKYDEIWMASKGQLSNQEFFNNIHTVDFDACQVNDRFAFPYSQFITQAKRKNLNDFDFIFLRLPPSGNAQFFEKLSISFDVSRILNNPNGILKTSSKAYLLELEQFSPIVKMVSSIEDVIDLVRRFQDVVLKPLRSYGGIGIIRIYRDHFEYKGEQYDISEFEALFNRRDQDYIGTRFLKNVINGDKRIVVAFGQVVSYRLRLPSSEGWLCNVSQGGTDVATSITDQEYEIIEYLTPQLEKEGIYMYGLDTIEDDQGTRIISEINTASIGGIAPFEKSTGTPSTRLVSELITAHFEKI